MLLPFCLCCLWLWHAGVFGKFWFWTIDYAREYASITSISEANSRFWAVLPEVVVTTLLLWLLAAAGLVLVWFDGRLRASRFWLLGFSLASALTVFPGFYFRPHYFLTTLPAVALLAGCAISGFICLQEKRGGVGPVQNSLMAVYAVFLAATVFVNRDLWLVKTPGQAAREIYGLPIFSAAENVAGFIRTNSVATARVAVIGCEPEIYFLADRRSATGYLYTYALVETQPFALKMQDEMISEIEAGAPEFIVFTDSSMSWGNKPSPDTRILTWWKSYRANYTRVGLADIISPTETAYAFGTNEVARYGKIGRSALEVFQRK
jgi:hypothetical protein